MQAGALFLPYRPLPVSHQETIMGSRPALPAESSPALRIPS